MASVHAIEKLNFNFGFGSAEGAEALEMPLRDFSATRAPAVIADVFDSYVGDDDIVQIDRLDLELGPLPTSEVEFEDRLRAALNAALENLLTTNGASFRSSRADMDMAHLWSVLGRGHGGWRSTGIEPSAIDLLVDRVLASSGTELAARFAAAPDQAARLARVAAQWSAAQQAKLAALLGSIAARQPATAAAIKTPMADPVAHMLALLRAESISGRGDPIIATILIDETFIIALCAADDRLSLIGAISRHWPSKRLWQIWLLIGLSTLPKSVGSELPSNDRLRTQRIIELVVGAGSLPQGEVRKRLTDVLDASGNQLIQLLASMENRAERLAHLVDAATPYQRKQLARRLWLMSPGAQATLEIDDQKGALQRSKTLPLRSARATAIWNTRLIQASAPQLPWWLSEWARARPGKEAIGRLATESPIFVRQQLAKFDQDPNWHVSLAANSNNALWAALFGTMVDRTEAALLTAMLDANETIAVASRSTALALLLDAEHEIVTATAIATAIVDTTSMAIGSDPAQVAARIVAAWPTASSAAVASLLSPALGYAPRGADRSHAGSRSAIDLALSRGIWPAALIAELHEVDPAWLAERLRRIGADARWRAQVAAQLDTNAMSLVVGLWVAAPDVAAVIDIAETLAGAHPGIEATAVVRYALLTVVLLNDSPRLAAVDVADRLIAVLAHVGVLDPAMLLKVIMPEAAANGGHQASPRPATPFGAVATVPASTLVEKLRHRLATSAEPQGERQIDRYDSPLVDAILRRQLADSRSRAALVESVSEGERRAILLRLAPLSGSAALKQVERLSSIADAIGWPVPSGASIHWDVLFTVIFGDEGGYDSVLFDRSWRKAWIATISASERPAAGAAFAAAAGSSRPTLAATLVEPDALGPVVESFAVPKSAIGDDATRLAQPSAVTDHSHTAGTIEPYAAPASTQDAVVSDSKATSPTVPITIQEQGDKLRFLKEQPAKLGNDGRFGAAADSTRPILTATPVEPDALGKVVEPFAVPGSTIGGDAPGPTQPPTAAARSPTARKIETRAAPASTQKAILPDSGQTSAPALISLPERTHVQRSLEDPLSAPENGDWDDGAMRHSGTLPKPESGSSLATADASQPQSTTVSGSGDLAFLQTKPGHDSGTSTTNIEEELAAGRFSAALIMSLPVPLTYPLRQAVLAGLTPARAGTERLFALGDKDRRRLLALLVPQEAAEALALVTGLEQLWHAARLPAGDRPDERFMWHVLLRFFVDQGRSFEAEAFTSLWLAAKASATNSDNAALAALSAQESADQNDPVNIILQRILHSAGVARPAAHDTAFDLTVPPVVMIDNEVIAIDNAGLALVAPYLPMLFSRLGLAENDRFIDASAQARAAQLLAIVVDGNGNAPESRLVLNKLLVGLDLATPLPRGVVATDPERAMIEGLLEAIIERWAKLGSTTVSGLREAFLQRPGMLVLADAGGDGSDDVKVWRLQVEERAYDVLVDLIPWGFRTVRLPWMPRMINVEWR